MTNTKGFIQVILLIVLIAVIGIAAFIFRPNINNTKEEVQQTPASTVYRDESFTITPVENNYKIVTSNKYNISFEFPD